MAVVRKKQDDKNLKILREIVTTGPGNRECFDCGQKGPTYVNMTIGSFVCTRCSGVLRGLTPPHRVKSISMATFTPDEIEFLKNHGNELCAKTWLGLWDPKRIVHQDQRELMIDKYERKRYFLEPASPLKSLTSSNTILQLNNNGNNFNNNSNNNSSNNSNNLNGGNKIIENNFKNITLTPPAPSNRHNGLSNGHRHTNGYKDDSFNNGLNGHQMKNNNQYQMRPNALNKTSLNLSSSLDSNGSSNNSSLNGFTPDTDFVADFNSANIFNANANNGYQQQQQQHQNGNNVNGNHLNGSTGSNENFADFDHAPIFNAAAIECDNIFSSNFKNSIQFYNNNNSSTSISNNNNSNMNFQQQNFFNSSISTNTTLQPRTTTMTPFSSQANSNNINFNRCENNNNPSSTSIHKFDSFSNNEFPSKIVQNPITSTLDINTNSKNSYFNQQWNAWQHFQWPPPTSQTALSSQSSVLPLNSDSSNRWSLPITGAKTNSSSNSMITVNSTPPADRYAALKDLDEQLRETKVQQSVFATPATTTAAAETNGIQNSANPFKTTSTPPMPIQHSNQQQQQIANPFQNGNGNLNGNHSFNATTNGNIFATQTQQQQQNLLQQQQQMHFQQQQFNNAFGTNTNFGVFNFANGNGVASNGNTVTNGYSTLGGQNSQQQQPATMLSTGANGCGIMGFSNGINQFTAGSNMSNMKNPFTASSALASNNPFL